MNTETDNGLKVCVIGASGIGQHHARWHTLCGSRVVGFAGTSDTSVARTTERLKSYFGFGGRGYTHVGEMLEKERPDIVAVASSYTRHKEHTIEALDFGAHVLCEKPLVWDEELTLDQILADGREVARAAEISDGLFCMTAQYPACLTMYRELCVSLHQSISTVETIDMEMEVKRRGPRKLFESNWIDVASHPLSLVIALLGTGIIVEGATCRVEEAECTSSFEYESTTGRSRVSIVLRDIVDGVPLRRFGVNGFMAEGDGFADENGIYRARLTHESQTVSGDDFLHTMIRDFTASVLADSDDVAVGYQDALLNLEHQVDLLRLSRESASAA
jgi:predicted dehydrogenase